MRGHWARDFAAVVFATRGVEEVNRAGMRTVLRRRCRGIVVAWFSDAWFSVPCGFPVGAGDRDG